MDNRVTDPERLKILAEEAKFIESLLDIDSTDYNTNIIYSDDTVSDIIHIEEDVDLVLNRDGEYVPYNNEMVFIEHRKYYVKETEAFFLKNQKIDEDVDRVIEVIYIDNTIIQCSDDLEGLIRTCDENVIFFNSEIAINNNYELKDNVWCKKEKIISSEVDRSKLTFLNDLEEAINKFYPDNWWFQEARYTFDFENPDRGYLLSTYMFPRDKQYCLIIKFPIIKITNSANQEHEIEDLYVVLPFNGYGNSSTSIYGFRSTFTNIEMSINYNHSHLPGLSEGKIDRFCLGSGPLVEILHRMNTKPFDKDLFSYFLANLTVYLEWESLDGGPYRKISDLLIKNTDVVTNNNVIYLHLKNLLNYILCRDIDLLLVYNNETGLLEVDFKKLECQKCKKKKFIAIN